MRDCGRVLGFIPARGGSKGLPGKNIRTLNGRPLIDYAINTALESNLDEVWVSTDCDDIEGVSLESGAKVLKRPESISRDDSPTEDAILHFAECVPNFDTLVMLQCTSPLTLVSDVESGIALYQESTYDTILSVCDNSGGFLCGGYNWEQLPNDNYIRYDQYYPCRQDAPKKYRENGAFYIMNKFVLLESKKRTGGSVGCYVMPQHRSFEIDYEHEFLFLDKLLATGAIDYMNEQ